MKPAVFGRLPEGPGIELRPLPARDKGDEAPKGHSTRRINDKLIYTWGLQTMTFKTTFQENLDSSLAVQENQFSC